MASLSTDDGQGKDLEQSEAGPGRSAFRDQGAVQIGPGVVGTETVLDGEFISQTAGSPSAKAQPKGPAKHLRRRLKEDFEAHGSGLVLGHVMP